jgi:cell division protein FtsZ
VLDEIRDQLSGSHMVFITAGMGGGTGTGAAPVVARCAREMGILTVGVVTKPFQFEGVRRMRLADSGINELQQSVDTLIVIPNQNLFRVATEKTTFADAFAMADQVLYSGVACITDLMVKEGLINLDFADVRAVMRNMGKAMMGTGESSGDKRALRAAEAAIANPLLDEVSMKGARGLLISITGGNDLTLYEVDEAATRIREEVDQDANIILGATFDESLEGIVRVSVVATGIDHEVMTGHDDLTSTEKRIAEVAERLRAEARARIAQGQPVPGFRTAQVETPRTTPLAPVAVAPVEVAAVPVMHNDVMLTPTQPKQAVAYEPPAPEPLRHEEAIAEGPFIAPQAERGTVRTPRMPRVDELPLPAQNQIRARHAEAGEPDSKRLTLLQRLATVGFGRKDEGGPAYPQAVEPVAPAPAPAPRPVAEAPRPVSPVHAEYAKRPPTPQAYRPAQGQLDPQGRTVPTARVTEEDQLEIPAFLRRQAK